MQQVMMSSLKEMRQESNSVKNSLPWAHLSSSPQCKYPHTQMANTQLAIPTHTQMAERFHLRNSALGSGFLECYGEVVMLSELLRNKCHGRLAIQQDGEVTE